MKFLTEKFKHHFKLQQHGKFHCKSCKRKERGVYLVLQDKGTKAADGTKAFRIFFTCGPYSHLTLVGYTKPVDFRDSYGEDLNEQGKTFEEEEREEEMELEEFLQFNPTHKRLY